MVRFRKIITISVICNNIQKERCFFSVNLPLKNIFIIYSYHTIQFSFPRLIIQMTEQGFLLTIYTLQSHVHKNGRIHGVLGPQIPRLSST